MLSVMGVKDCREIAWEHALTARMNAAYYGHKVWKAKLIDTGLKLVSIFTALSGCGTFVAEVKLHGVDLSPWLTAAAALAMAIDLALQFPERVRELGLMQSEYTAHQGRFERLFQFGCTDDEVKQALDAFQETVQKETKIDPVADDKLLTRMQDKVLRSIQAG